MKTYFKSKKVIPQTHWKNIDEHGAFLLMVLYGFIELKWLRNESMFIAVSILRKGFDEEDPVLEEIYSTGWLHKDTHEGKQNKSSDLAFY